jgi:hypothetical protein
MSTTKTLLLQGAFDAAGFVLGAMAAYFVGKAFGLDLFAQGYESGSMGAILLSGLGAGLGVAIARKIYRKVILKE